MKQLELDETPHYCGVYPSGHDAKDKDTFTHLGRQNTRFTNTEHLRAIEKLYGLDNPTETGVYFCLFNNADRPFFEHWEEKPIKLASHFGAYIMERVIFMPFNMGLQEDGIQSVFYFGEDITRDDCPIKKAIRLCYRSSL